MKILKGLVYFLFINVFSFLYGASDIYGINAHTPQESIVRLIKNAHIVWARIDINWYEVEKEDNTFDWRRIDNAVNSLQKMGIKIFATVAYSPSWASSNGKINGYPKDVNFWKDFIRRAALRYSDRIKYWGIWNEPNLEKFFSGTADDYVNKLLIPAYNTIKDVNRSLSVVAPGVTYLTGANSRWDNWLRDILKIGKDYIDVIDFHIYDDRGVPFIIEKLEKGSDLLPSVFSVIDEMGAGDKPFWITEVGWSTSVVSEDEQAENYFEMLKYALNSPRIDKLFFYVIMDDPEWNDYYGIVRADYSLKKAYYTYKNFIENEDQFKEDEGDDGKKGCSLKQNLLPGSPMLKVGYLVKDEVLREIPLGSIIISQYYKESNNFYNILKSYPEIRKELRKVEYGWLFIVKSFVEGENIMVPDKLILKTDALLKQIMDITHEKEIKMRLETYRKIVNKLRGKTIFDIYCDLFDKESLINRMIKKIK